MIDRQFRIMMTSDVVGGVWDFSIVLAQSLIGRGHTVDLLAFGVPTYGQRQVAARIGATLWDADLKLEWMQESADDVDEARRLVRQLVWRLQPDLLHTSQFAFGDLDVPCPVVLTAHSDVLSWISWTDHGGADAPVASRWSNYCQLVRTGLDGADVVTSVSHFQAGELIRQYKTLARPVVIANGWPAAGVTAIDWQDRPVRSVLGGRVWDRAKNVETAAKAARLGLPGEVLLVGDGHHPEHGGSVIHQSPMRSLGPLDRSALDELLGSARVFVAPSRYEPFGLLPLQAAVRGCALLLSDIPTFRELWADCALFFPPNDAGAFKQAWERLLTDAALATSLIRSSRQRALQRFGIDRCVDSYLSIYNALPTRRADRRAAAWVTA